MDFPTIRDVVMLVLMFLVFGAPALALAARLAIRPVADAIVLLQKALASSERPAPDARVAALEEEVGRLAREVRRLAESEAFTRQLSEGKPAAARPGATLPPPEPPAGDG